MSEIQSDVARALIEIGAVRFTPHEPITFKSGMVSPVYVDNRRLPFWPEAWRLVITGFENLILREGLHFDVFAGIETAGIPHSAVLAFEMGRPSVFVRKEAKAHGEKKRVEGGDVSGQRVLLIEDHVTTGGSSLAGVFALRDEGADVSDCLAVTSYGFAEAVSAFNGSGVRLHVLASFDALAEAAHEMGQFGEAELAVLADWSRDPPGWAARQGFNIDS